MNWYLCKNCAHEFYENPDNLKCKWCDNDQEFILLEDNSNSLFLKDNNKLLNKMIKKETK